MPQTDWAYDKITLTDQHPATKQFTTFTFTRRMVAWPLTQLGAQGSPPNNKAAWWPYFQERHKLSGLYWVQGHLLNHNIHGPGVPDNLVPISGTLNTNMEAIVESLAKKAIDKGEVLYYEVVAHFNGATSTNLANVFSAQTTQAKQLQDLWQEYKKAGHTLLSEVMAHPWAVRNVYGIKGVDADGTLLWGEQFAPTGLSWRLAKSTNWQIAPDWTLQSHALQEIERSDHISPSQWANHYPV
jgi:hypothetical protein